MPVCSRYFLNISACFFLRLASSSSCNYLNVTSSSGYGYYSGYSFCSSGGSSGGCGTGGGSYFLGSSFLGSSFFGASFLGGITVTAQKIIYIRIIAVLLNTLNIKIIT